MEEVINSPNSTEVFNQWIHVSMYRATPKCTPPILGCPVNCYSHGVLPLQCFVEYLLT
jgi:hypothetical protein